VSSTTGTPTSSVRGTVEPGPVQEPGHPTQLGGGGDESALLLTLLANSLSERDSTVWFGWRA
jgi:hypothetical protein